MPWGGVGAKKKNKAWCVDEKQWGRASGEVNTSAKPRRISRP